MPCYIPPVNAFPSGECYTFDAAFLAELKQSNVNIHEGINKAIGCVPDWEAGNASWLVNGSDCELYLLVPGKDPAVDPAGDPDGNWTQHCSIGDAFEYFYRNIPQPGPCDSAINGATLWSGNVRGASPVTFTLNYTWECYSKFEWDWQRSSSYGIETHQMDISGAAVGDVIVRQFTPVYSDSISIEFISPSEILVTDDVNSFDNIYSAIRGII